MSGQRSSLKFCPPVALWATSVADNCPKEAPRDALMRLENAFRSRENDPGFGQGPLRFHPLLRGVWEHIGERTAGIKLNPALFVSEPCLSGSVHGQT